MPTGPRELVDALLLENWGQSFQPFTDRDRRCLDAFNDLCWKLATRTFFTQPSGLHFGSYTIMRGANEEAMEVAGVVLRRVLLAGEATNHDTVVEILRRRVRPGPSAARTHALLEELQRRFNSAQAEPLMHRVDQADLDAGRFPEPVETFDAARVLDDWLHGTVVSGDAIKRANVERWSGITYEWSVAKALRSLGGAVLETHVVVRGALGVLDVDRRSALYSAETTPIVLGSPTRAGAAKPYVLDRPAEIYRPFTREETTRLRAYAANVRRLGHMRFFEQAPKAAKLALGGRRSHQEMREPDDEAVRAAITQFRQVYNPNEPTSYRPTFNLLKRSVHERGGPLAGEAIQELDAHVDSERNRVRAGLGTGVVVGDSDEQSSIDVRQLLDAYLHGHYLHSANTKSELVARLEEAGPLGRMTLFSTMNELRDIFWIGANVVDCVLGTPALLDADSRPTVTCTGPPPPPSSFTRPPPTRRAPDRAQRLPRPEPRRRTARPRAGRDDRRRGSRVCQ